MEHALRSTMPLIDSLEVLIDSRDDEQIVITTMGAAREWPKLADHPLDFHFVPSTMGGSLALGVGLALAQPQRHVVVVSGDGSLLMGLGSLVTVAASGATNISIVLIDNGVYEVTGSQTTAGTVAKVDYVALAEAAGIQSAVSFDNLDDWQQNVDTALAVPGPRLIRLVTEPTGENYHITPPGPIGPRLSRFVAALGQTG